MEVLLHFFNICLYFQNISFCLICKWIKSITTLTGYYIYMYVGFQNLECSFNDKSFFFLKFNNFRDWFH